jgi:hypothetical protein
LLPETANPEYGANKPALIICSTSSVGGISFLKVCLFLNDTF